MTDEEAIKQVASLSWSDKILWTTVGLMMLGTMARTLVSNEPFCIRRFLGEMIFSAIGAVILYSFGLMQGMNPIQIIFFGGLGSLGGVRMLEWLMKIAKQVKQNAG